MFGMMTVNNVEGRQGSVNAGNPIITEVNDVNERNNSSFNTVNPVITTVDDVDEKKSSINKGNLQSTATDLLQELSLYETMIEGLMKPEQLQSGWSMINTLASFAVSKANLLKRHDEKLLPSAIMRIALDIFDSRDQLEKPLNSKTIEHLLGKESEYVPVALELLDWILSGEIISPELTGEMQDGFDFDFLAALKSNYHESATKDPERIIQSDASIRKARSVPLTLHPSSGLAKIDAVRTGIPGRVVAVVRSLLFSRFEEPSIEKLQEKKRAQMVDWIFSFTAVVPSLPDLPFSAVDILDCSLMEHAERIYELSDKENRPVLVAAVKLAATKEMGSVNGRGLGAQRYRRRSTLDPIKVIESAQLRVVEWLGCEAEDIKHWEEEHAKILDHSTNASTHMQSTHLVRKLRESLTLIEGLMKPRQVKSGISMIETLASFAVSKANLKRHGLLLLDSAIMRIALDIFTSRDQQLKENINTEISKLLFGEESEHVPVALELLDWILSGEMILSTLSEKMLKDLDFDARNELQKISSHMRKSQS